MLPDLVHFAATEADLGELARGEALDSDDVLGELPPYDLSSAHHHAVLRRRGQRYGAELLTLGFDTIELVVDRPPAAKDEALAMAREQFAYCPHIMWQGVATIGALAATQARFRLWHFRPKRPTPVYQPGMRRALLSSEQAVSVLVTCRHGHEP